MKLIVFFLVQFISIKTMSQVTVQGEYIFNRHEMVAGFNFLPEGKFDFFFSYGAVDRTATGTFTVEGNVLKLKSDKVGGKDFTITSQSKAGKGYTIKFQDANKYLLANIHCMFFIGEKKYDEFTDQNGEVKVEFAHCDKIYVQHDLFPDIVTIIKDENNTNNNFTLTLNSSLGQVSFKYIDFKIDDDKTISCIPNYFMMLEDIKFKKQ